MDLTHLAPTPAAGLRTKQMEDAKEMARLIQERAARIGAVMPDYEFLELIGKGSFGRVYKCKKPNTQELVAIKIINVDELDYKLDNQQKDEAIADFTKEVSTLKHLKDSKAKNINYIQEAFDLHSQLWIVSDYCPGGSVHTLMKACPSGGGLEQHFIIPIARELAVALKYVHDAGVIHRDVKCGNVLISEEGHVQLCDFGVAAIKENDASKRSTIIGTPFWMPPEMHSTDPDVQVGYGTEVDCWAYGCTVYEMATGMPPNHKFHPFMLRTVLKAAPRLQEGDYSQELRDFVAFCLEESPQDRPSANEMLEHPYIANTHEQYPTESLRQMIDRYVQWERKGGQRVSLFNPYGAAAPQSLDEDKDYDDWNFSTTDNFDRDFERRYSQLGIAATDFAFGNNDDDDDDNDDDNDEHGGSFGEKLPSATKRGLTPLEEAQEELKAKRGEKSMGRLFDPNADPYDYNTPMEDDPPLSDLPLRNMSSDRAANRETLIDLDMGGSDLDVQPNFSFDFGDVPTLKAARATRASTFVPEDEEQVDDYSAMHDQDTKRATKDWKMPWSTAVAENPNRKTLDWKMPWSGADGGEEAPSKGQEWKFPLSEIATENPSRRTQDWTFATAEVSKLAADDNEFSFPSAQDDDDDDDAEINPGFRPHLTRTATEPIGQFKDFLHPPAQITLTADNDVSSVRDSTPVIDLDLAIDTKFEPNFDFDNTVALQMTQRESSPGISVAGSTDTRHDPFFLDEVDRQADEEGKRSSHRQSRSEPYLLGQSDRRSRLLHSRGPSTESILRHSRDRGYSLSSTASSDVLESNWGRDYNRRMGEHTREQLMNDLQVAARAPRTYGWHSRMNSYDTETDGVSGLGVRVPGMDEAGFPTAGMRPLRSLGTSHESMDDRGYGGLGMARSRSRAGTGASTATSGGYDSSKDEATTYVPRPHNRMGQVFPRIVAPDADAMGEMAEQDLVDQEVERLLENLQQGLEVAADMFHRRDRELGGMDELDDMQQHFVGFGSEGEGEGQY